MDLRRGHSDSAANDVSKGKSKKTVLAQAPHGSLDFYPKESLPIKRSDTHEKRGESVDNADSDMRNSRTPVKRGYFDEVAVSTISVGNSRQQKRSLVNLQNAVGVLSSNSNDLQSRLHMQLQPSRLALSAARSSSLRDVKSMQNEARGAASTGSSSLLLTSDKRSRPSLKYFSSEHHCSTLRPSRDYRKSEERKNIKLLNSSPRKICLSAVRLASDEPQANTNKK